jgi:hypothetical protein
MAENIIICTLIMWVLTSVAVVPLTNAWFKRAVVNFPDITLDANGAPIDEEAKARCAKLYSTKFIQADVLVMGVAGLIAGLAGFPLVGFAWKAKAWPGLLAMIGASFLGFSMVNGRVF